MVIYVDTEITKIYGIVERVSNEIRAQIFKKSRGMVQSELAAIELIWMMSFGDMHLKTEEF